MESERSVTWNYWKGDLSPRRLETTSVWRNARTGDMQREPLGLISVWIYIHGYLREAADAAGRLLREAIWQLCGEIISGSDCRNGETGTFTARRTCATPIRDGN